MSALILNIDDDEVSRYVRSRVLRAAGFEVIEAATGEDGLRMAREGRPAIVLLDIKLPDVSGVAVCRRLKEAPATSAIPIVHVTAFGSSYQVEGLDAGANAYLPEPVEPAVLVATIRNLLRGREAEETRIAHLRSHVSIGQEAAEILESIPEAFLAFDGEMRLTYANGEAVRLLGRSREKMLGRTYLELDPAPAGTATFENYRRALRERVNIEFENYYEPWDRWFDVKVCPERSGGIAVYFRDVTETKRTREALQATETRLMRLIHSSVIGITTATREGLRYANDEFLRMVGYTRADLEAGRADWMKATDPADLAKDLRGIEELVVSGECAPFEKTYIRPDGTRNPVLIGAVKLHDEPLEWVAFVIDRTAEKQTESELRTQQERLALAARVARIASWDVDVETKIVTADPLLCEMFGLDEPLATAPEWISRIHPEDQGRVANDLKAVYEGTGTYDLEYRTVADGVIRWVYATATAVRDEAGRAVRLVGIAQDITERKRREAELREMSTRLDFHLGNTPIAVVEYDSEFRIVRWSGQAQTIFGWTAEEVAGKRFDEFRWIHEADAERVQQIAAQLVAGQERNRSENRNYDKQGGVVFMDWYNSARFDAGGRISSLLSLGVDVSARVQAEQELTRLTEELRQSNEELQQFAYAVSHDLKEPLRNVSACAELFRRKYETGVDAAGISLLGYVTAGAERMQRFIDDLLEYSRTRKPEDVSFGVVQMTAALTYTISNLTQAIRERGAEITHGASPVVSGDSARLCQVLQNLVGNAIKYCPEDRTPRIHVSAERTGDFWRFRVEDNGVGIAREYLDQVFLPFKRLHGSEKPGSGIGLSICKRIIEQHGGEIWAESEEGSGAAFVFTIPARVGHRPDTRSAAQ